MSSYDSWKTRSGDDEQDALNFGHVSPPNAVCPTCGQAFFKGRDDIGTLCDVCCQVRDAIAEWQRTHPKEAR